MRISDGKIVVQESVWPRVLKYAGFLILIAVVVVGNRLIQTQLGKEAIIQTGFESLAIDEAIGKAKAENKLVFVELSAVFCPTCRKLDQKIFSNPEVKQAINKDYVFTRVEYSEEEGDALMKRYKVKGFPTLFLVDGNGDLVRHVSVTFDPAEFIASI